jgi:hypothetical protein
MPPSLYISEIQFRNCEYNNLSSYPPFIIKELNNRGKIELQIGFNANFNPAESTFVHITIKILSTNDTFHDLLKDRGEGYNSNVVLFGGLLDYLMTGDPERFLNPTTFGNQYKNWLNSPKNTGNNAFNEYRGTFENKAASVFETRHYLQPADTIITYADICANTRFDGDKYELTESFHKMIKRSNGSITIVPYIEKTSTFSNYIESVGDDDKEGEKTDMKILISYFIRWYLHSPNLNQNNSIILTESMKILSDAGLSFLGDIFGVRGSNVTPYIAVPVFLDSAGSSTSLVDPEIPIAYEELSSEMYPNDYTRQIVPIVSNYFSCGEGIFMCYVVNPKSTFSPSNFFCFSLCIINLTNTPNEQLLTEVNIIRTYNLTSTKYNAALGFVLNYINTYPDLVARYYFGEATNDFAVNDNSQCGKCGAGVPYIGNIIGGLNDFINELKRKQ